MQIATISVDVLMKLAGSGNVRGIEEQWMSALETESVSPGQIAEWSTVLEELAKRERTTQAESLAWSAIETLKEKFSPAEAIPAAGAFLMKLGDSAELRKLVTDLYKLVYKGRPGLEKLLAEAGLAGGRPPRRALRIADVGLASEPGAYLAGRHEDVVVRVESVDCDAWQVTFQGPDGQETLGAVELADRFAPVAADDLRVLRQFDPQRLRELADSDATGVIINLLKSRGPTLDGDAIEELLCPVPIEKSRWGKWWAAARTALKRSPNVRVEGRPPYYLTYVEVGESLEQETLAKLRTATKPADELSVLEGYVRECRARKQPLDEKFLATLRADWIKRAEREHRGRSMLELTTRLLVASLDQVHGKGDPHAPVIALLKAAADPVPFLRGLEVASLWPAACDALDSAVGERRVEILAKLLPKAPQVACDGIATRLIDAGATREVLETVVQEIMANPTVSFDALAWLWEGSDSARKLPAPPAITLLTKILTVLGEVRRAETSASAPTKALQIKARAALSAKKYERFSACLDEIEQGMAVALRTQILRLENLGRSVHDDLLTRIRHKFPQLYSKAKVPAWQQDDVLYVTRDGMSRKEAEIHELVHVKMKENARAIGDAAARGDLSENSEYKFALEERDLLRARLAQMNDEMSKAKLIVPDDVATDEASIGTRVTLRAQSGGGSLTLTFLGPWDGDLERGIVNYRSPLGQSLMSRHVGDVLDIELGDLKGAYVIDRIENALLSEPAPATV